jgi:hypothetical protein
MSGPKSSCPLEKFWSPDNGTTSTSGESIMISWSQMNKYIYIVFNDTVTATDLRHCKGGVCTE